MHLSTTRIRLSLPDLWRRQVGCQLKDRRRLGGRGFAVVQFVPPAKCRSKLVDIRQLAIVVLQDEFGPGNYPWIRFAAYRLAPVPWGLAIGGREQVILDKDLASAPARPGLWPTFRFPGSALVVDCFAVRQEPLAACSSSSCSNRYQITVSQILGGATHRGSDV